LVRRQDDVMCGLAETVALTGQGIALKAAIVLRTLPVAADVFELDADMPELRLALSLARDATGLN